MSISGRSWLLLLPLLAPRAAGTISPMRRSSGLRLLRRLAANDPNTVAVDIGGTLAKVIVFQPETTPPAEGETPKFELGEANEHDVAFWDVRQRELSVYVPQLHGSFHFFVFETRHIRSIINFISRHSPKVWKKEEVTQVRLRATGGGSFKHADAFKEIGFDLDVGDEHTCIVAGLNFLLHQVPASDKSPEVFLLPTTSYSPLATPEACKQLAAKQVAVLQPPERYIYVSIGSGVSILEIERSAGGGTKYRRVGGSSVGGSTFWGLVKLLTSCETFDEVIRLTESGSSANVDMLVGDIYGGDCSSIGLGADVIASSFGKISMQREDDAHKGPMLLLRYLAALLRHYEEGFWLVVLALVNCIPGVKQLATALGLVRFGEARAASVAMCGGYRAHDVALSLLRMVSNNIGQIAYMCAKQRGIQHIIFGGSFIRDHPFTISTISSGVHFFSQGSMQALFLRHDGFVGALGSFFYGKASAGAIERMPPLEPHLSPHKAEDVTQGATIAAPSRPSESPPTMPKSPGLPSNERRSDAALAV
ncbi:hypothetical protein AB1Y20_019007 [Prymnesium parvum]|uniref:Pantothenate kinase n=1 Tax=Prymnesium parvum TaxID=97485 RepID=A0AB34JT37_PRYPA